MKNLLFITNGHGEDQVAAALIKQLPGQDITTLSLVNTNLPSGGFSLRNFKYLLQDIHAGLIANTLKNIGFLFTNRGKYDLVVCIGDIVPMIAACIIKAPFIFIGVNKSSYYQWFGYNYTPWELFLLDKYSLRTYVRDQYTFDQLKDKIKHLQYVGNPLMDITSPTGEGKTRALAREEVRIGLLPGTREDARLNIEDFAKVAAKMPNNHFIIATKEQSPFENVGFDELLARSDIIIGLSGTGNEQAAGSGIPVISFYGRGAQYNKKFALAQKQLLGDALLLLGKFNADKLAMACTQLLNNRDKIRSMGDIGKQRMGKKGALIKIAQDILI